MLNVKSKNGITLIALIITIIVMIILIGVTVQQIISNGLLIKSEEARQTQLIEQIKEHINFVIYEAQTKHEGNASLKDIIDELELKFQIKKKFK